jgi:hypothetical protein
MPAASSANPLKTVRELHLATDAAIAASWENPRMRAPHLRTERARRTEAVIELLRRRAERRRARGQAVPAALHQAIDDFDRPGHPEPSAPARQAMTPGPLQRRGA